MSASGLVTMSVVKCCVVVLFSGLMCLVGETLSSICCSLPTAVPVPCNRSITTLPPSSVEDSQSSEIVNDLPTESIGSDNQSGVVDGIGDPEIGQDEGTSARMCYEYYCGTVQVEAADTYCSYEPCDSTGCHCTDCIDGSYRSPISLRMD